ncbi:MAG: hypothetical protein AB1673_07655 [Actinomycetota bacterium]
MTPSPTLRDVPFDGDEVARQRRRRAEGHLNRPVAGFDMTLNDVLRSVVAATHESAGPLDVEAFLRERGHAWQTVEMVQVCLKFVDLQEEERNGPR